MPNSDALHTLTSGRLLARNTLWNLLGQGLPVLVAIFTIPILIRGMGVDRFGVLTLAWIVIGYFNLFDMGIGRALIVLLSTKLGEEDRENISSLVWTAIGLMFILGLVAGLVLIFISPWLVYVALKVPLHLQKETLTAFYFLSASVPLVITTAGFRGVLASYQRFDLINAIRIPNGVFNYLGPLLILFSSQSLVPMVAFLVVVRVITWAAYISLGLRVMPALRHDIRFSRTFIGSLLRTGGWMTVSNVVGPLMVYLDRFLIGALISTAAVAYYATPYEVVTRLRIFPAAIMGVIFPAFAVSFAGDSNRVAWIFNRGMKYIFLIMFPITLIVVTLTGDILDFWLGAEFAQNSAVVMQLLTVGVLFNSLTQTPFAFLQGAGRADITAKIHLVELPFYLLIIWWLIGTYGIVGAAAAWAARVGLDMVLALSMARRFLPPGTLRIRPVLLVGSSSFIALVAGSQVKAIAMEGLYLGCALFIFILLAWFFILIAEERTMVKNFGGRMFKIMKAR